MALLSSSTHVIFWQAAGKLIRAAKSLVQVTNARFKNVKSIAGSDCEFPLLTLCLSSSLTLTVILACLRGMLS